MDIQIIENMKEILQVIIHCRQIDDEVMRLKCHIELFVKKLQAKNRRNLHTGITAISAEKEYVEWKIKQKQSRNYKNYYNLSVLYIFQKPFNR